LAAPFITRNVIMLELLHTRVTLTKLGTWTFAAVGELPFKPKTHFGVLKVNGRIDGVTFENCSLMPMKKGGHFLPVSAALRKQLGKQAGDEVELQLFIAAELAGLDVSLADFRDCLAEVPAALQAFEALPPVQQQQWLSWVAQATSDEQKVARMEAALEQLGGANPAGLVFAAH
jgi:hypothetical protein